MIKALSENPGHIQALCSRLDIGTGQRELRRVFGGFHHKMWRLESDRGTYAVKQLSPDTDLAEPDVARHFNITESVAETFASCGISAIFALKHNTNYVQIIDNIGYLVYPWTDALAVSCDNISEKHVMEVGRAMARMHGADIDIPELQTVPFDTHSEEKIILLVHRAVECGIQNADLLREQLPNYLSIVDGQKAAIQILEKHVVVSHGDMDHKNVLWNDSGTPVIIDWESARKLNPTHETLLEALDWSGITSDFNHSLLQAFISTYREAGGVIEGESLQASFDCILGDWLSWLMYNVGRSMDPEDAEQRSIGSAQVELSLSAVLRLGHLLPWLMSR